MKMVTSPKRSREVFFSKFKFIKRDSFDLCFMKVYTIGTSIMVIKALMP